MEKHNEKLEAALQYAGAGWSIIPCTKDKRPHMPWVDRQNKKANEDEIREWWQTWPDANVGVVTGSISGIIALDIDAKHNRTPEEFDLPLTATSKTGGGGWHYLFTHPGYHIKSLNGKLFGPGIDLKADGGFIVLPPSDHQSGNKYQWITVPNNDSIANIPKWLEEKIKNYKEEPASAIYPTQVGTYRSLNLKECVGVNEGSRNENMHKLSCSLYARGYSDEDVTHTVLEINRTYNPPLTNREIETILLSARKFVAISNKKKTSETSSPAASHALVTCFANIKPEPIQWLWPGRFALGKLTLLAGDPGLGKSLITVDMAATVSRGKSWPVDGSSAPMGDVVFLSAEDDPADTIRPRLDAAGADCNRVHILEAVHDEQQQGESKRRIFNLSRDCAVLEKMITALPNCKLVIIDPVSAYLGGTDSHNNADIRGLLAPLADIASRFNVAVVIVSHLNKSDQGKAIYRVMGSLAFSAAARAAFIVMKDKDNEERRLFLPIKNNLAKDRDGYAYTVTESENNAPHLAWEPELVSNIADEAIAEAESQEDHTETEWAEMFLEDLLSHGPMLVQDVNKEARIAGIKDKPLRRARENLGVVPKKVGYSQGWMWVLPGHEDALVSEDAHTKTEGTLEERGTFEKISSTEDAQLSEDALVVTEDTFESKKVSEDDIVKHALQNF